MFKLREIKKKVFDYTLLSGCKQSAYICAIFRSTLNIGPMPREDVCCSTFCNNVIIITF